MGLIPGLGRSSGGGNGNLFQNSCRKNPTDRGTWQATVHGVTKSRTQLSTLSYTQPVPTAFSMAFKASYKMLSPYPQWHPIPVLLPRKSHRQRSLVDCSPWGRWGLDVTERLPFHFSLSCVGEGSGNPLQCSCLENPRDGGAWWAAVYGVAQSRTWLKWLSSPIPKNFSTVTTFISRHHQCVDYY